MATKITTEVLRHLCEAASNLTPGKVMLEHERLDALCRAAEALKRHPDDCYETWGDGDDNETREHLNWRDLRDEVLAAVEESDIEVSDAK